VTANQTIRWVLKPGVFLAGLIPFGLLLQGALTGNLGADPLKAITDETGVWTLRFLCVTLTMTPVRRLTGWNAVIRFRRMLGLFAFFYGTVHLLIFIVADRLASLGFPSLTQWRSVQALALSIGSEILVRPYITVGFISWVCMLALAATSPASMVRRLGGRRWQMLHRLIYVAAVAGVVHYWWLVKADIRHPEAYAAVVGGLLAFRLVWAMRARSSVPARPAPGRTSATPAAID
jgi:sulfoxide reductase heme-binding subunit YedZ